MVFRVKVGETYLPNGALIAYIDGRVRGAQTASVNFPSTGIKVYKILIFNDKAGDDIIFKYYDILADKFYSIVEIIEFVPNQIPDYANPIILNANPEIPNTYYEVRVGTNTADCSFFVDGVTYNSWQTFTWAAGSSHLIGTSSQQGTGGIRHVWQTWNDEGEISHSIIVPIGGTTYRANFLTEYLLTISSSPASGGSVGADPSSTDGYYYVDTPVLLTAVASAGNTFSGWTGDLAGISNPGWINMGSPKSVTAIFTQAPIASPCINETFTALYGTITDGSGSSNYLDNQSCEKLIIRAGTHCPPFH